MGAPRRNPPKTRYARSGEAHIAYQVHGDGPRDLVLVPGFVSNVEHQWEMPNIPEIFDRLASFSRLIIWDKRGTGLSDPVAGVPTLEERMDDLRAVLDAVGSERAALFGISEGGPMSVLFAATYPERTTELVLYGTAPRFSQAPDCPYGWTEEETSGHLDEINRIWGEGALLELFAPSYADNELMREIWGRFQRAGASPSMARRVIEALAEIDVRGILPAVNVPTLILHRRDERVASVEGARFAAERMPNAKLVEFDGQDHLPMVGNHDEVTDEIEEFLTGSRRPRQHDRILSTVLFTDIVGSTERAAGLGDRDWRELLERHDEIFRRQLARYDGTEVKRTGDGFLATFDGPARAVRCAADASEALRVADVQIRAGVHTGECERMGNDIGGMAVHIAARVMAEADADEVLVSSTVKDLVVGSGLSFDDRGARSLKGVPDEWRLFAASA